MTHRVTMTALLSMLVSVSVCSAPQARTATAPSGGIAAKADGSRAMTTYPGGMWEPGPAKFGVEIVEDVPITMDDGVVLRAVVAFPTDLKSGKRASGRFPVVVEHTPYVRTDRPTPENVYLTGYGYIYAVVRERGTGASGGEVGFYDTRGGKDGKTLVDWAAHKLEGADGRVAFVGCSAPAGLALADMAFVGKNSPLKAAVIACNGLEGPYREAWFVSGMMTTGFLYYAPRAPSTMGDSDATKRFFSKVHSDILAGGPPAYDNGYYDDRLPMRWANDIVAADIPVLLWTGWKDILESPALRTYTAFQNAYSKRPVDAQMIPGQKLTPRYQIIVGPWEHALGLHSGIYLQWLETWLKGVDTGIGKTRTPMHLYEVGSERWINTQRYPVVPRYTSYNLDAEGGLTTRTSAKGESARLQFGDPDQAGGRLSFTTEPFAQGATLAGPVSATIFAKSSNTNLALLPHLYDVAPDGSQTIITKGAVLGSLRDIDRTKSWTDSTGKLIWPWLLLKSDSYLKPEQIYRLEVPLAPRQYGLAPGHRLRLELISQNPKSVCPENWQPAGNGNDPCGLTAPQKASLPGGAYDIFFSSGKRSQLHLPLLGWKQIPEARSAVLPLAGDRTKPGSGPITHPIDWDGSDRP